MEPGQLDIWLGGPLSGVQQLLKRSTSLLKLCLFGVAAAGDLVTQLLK
jgi:hypothetical protein